MQTIYTTLYDIEHEGDLGFHRKLIKKYATSIKTLDVDYASETAELEISCEDKDKFFTELAKDLENGVPNVCHIEDLLPDEYRSPGMGL